MLNLILITLNWRQTGVIRIFFKLFNKNNLKMAGHQRVHTCLQHPQKELVSTSRAASAPGRTDTTLSQEHSIGVYFYISVTIV